MPTVDIYSKQQVDDLIAGAGGLPDPTSASAGDVLTLDSNKDPAWVAPSGGMTLHTYTSWASAVNDIIAHPLCRVFFNHPQGGEREVAVTSIGTGIGNSYHIEMLCPYFMMSTTNTTGYLKQLYTYYAQISRLANASYVYSYGRIIETFTGANTSAPSWSQSNTTGTDISVIDVTTSLKVYY